MGETERTALVGEVDTGLPHAGGGGQRRAESRPPWVLGSSLFLQLKSLHEAPPPAGREGSWAAGEGGARALWKAVFSGKPKGGKKRDGGVFLAGNKGRTEAGRSTRATGNAVMLSAHSPPK